MTNDNINYEINIFGDYYLSPERVSDAQSVYEAFIRKEVTANLAGPHTDPYTYEDAVDFLTNTCEVKNRESPYPLFWAIRSRKVSNPSLIGCIDIRPSNLDEDLKKELPDPSLEEKFAFFGFWLDPSYRLQGIMSAALKALIYEIGYKRYGIKYYYGDCFAGNIGSRKTFEKNGFKFVKFVKDGAVKLNPYQVRDKEIFELRLE